MPRAVYIGVGTFLALIGSIVVLSPVPLGFTMLIPGIALLIHGSHRFAAWVRLRRARNLEINSKAVMFASRAPGFIGAALRRTDPHITAGPRIDPTLR